MTLAPRFLVRLWAALRTARFVGRQRFTGRGAASQVAALQAQLAQFAGTEFGRRHGLRRGLTYAQFRNAVPLRTYADFAPFIQRMAEGEPNVLAAGKCSLFVESAGALGAQPKLLPVPPAMLAHFRRGLRDTLLQYAHRTASVDVFLGRHLHVGAATALQPLGAGERTSLDGILALCASPWSQANLYAPPASLAQMPEGEDKLAALARAGREWNVTLLGGTPAVAEALATALRSLPPDDRPAPVHLQAAWPKLECFLHTGAPLGLFGDALRQHLGPAVRLHELYAAAEGIFAAQDAGTPAALRVLADSGLFLEFLPVTAGESAVSPGAGAPCVTLAQVRTGVNYRPVVTTPAGLARYVMDDIVRFVTADPPRLQVVGRVGLQLSVCGEDVGERDVFDTLQAVCARNGWRACAVHVAPFSQRLGPGQMMQAHEWWLELHTHTVRTPTANVFAPELDAELARRSASYAARRAARQLGEPQVRLVMPGVFARWARQQGRTASASKLPRCRPDRLIADQLQALAPFHQPTIVPWQNQG